MHLPSITATYLAVLALLYTVLAVQVGRLRQRSWETPEGQRRSVTEVEVENVGPSLEWATASVTKAARAEGSSSSPAFVGAASSDNGAADEEPPF